MKRFKGLFPTKATPTVHPSSHCILLIQFILLVIISQSSTREKEKPTLHFVNARFDASKPVSMLVRDENGIFETTSASKLTIDEEFKKSRHCPSTDFNNNDNNNDTNNNNAQLVVTSDDVSIDRSSIKSFYRNACILVTGGTGFVGKVLLEKLLRTCDNLQCIYVLLRSKRGRSSEERYHELIQNPVIVFVFFVV